MCDRKVAYPDQRSARAAAHEMGEKHAYPFRAFKCNVGRSGEKRHWHIGRYRSGRV